MTSSVLFHGVWHLNFFVRFKNAAVSPPSSGPRYLYHLSIFLHNYLNDYHAALIFVALLDFSRPARSKYSIPIIVSFSCCFS
jgi:hypothetical protein